MKKIFSLYADSFKGLSIEVWWLAIITLINRAGTMVTPFLSLYLTEGLDFTLKDVGWVMSSFGLGSVIGSWLGGKLTDKIGTYKIMIASLVGSGLLFIALQYIHDFYWLCANLCLLMIIADMFRPAMFVALSSYSKPENKTRSVTLIRLAINLGFSAGPVIGGLIIIGLGYSGLFWLDGITCILAGLLILGILNPKKTQHFEEERIEHPISAYSDRTYWLFIVSMLLFGLIFLQLFSTVPVYYSKGLLMTEFEVGLLFAMNGFLIFIFEMPLVKWLENRNKSKETLMIIGLAMVGLSFLLLVWGTIFWVLILSVILVTFGEMIFFPFSNAFAMERSNRGNKGEYMALYSIAFSIGHVFSHNIGMQLASGIGFSSTWYIVFGTSILGIFLLYLLKKSMREKENC